MKNIDRKQFYDENIDFIRRTARQKIEHERQKISQFNEKAELFLDELSKRTADVRFEQIRKMLPSIPKENEIEAKIAEIERYYYKNCFHDPFSSCLEKTGDIDIKPYLDMIRNNNHETLLILVIENNKIIDNLIIEGKTSFDVSPLCDAYIEKYSKHPQAQYYEVHNHPGYLVAEPSSNDIKSSTNEEMRKKVSLPLPYDWGIVTAYDYYSYSQTKK